MKLDLLKPKASYVEAGTDIDAGSYNEIVAATPKRASAIAVENTTDQTVKLAVGAAASEVDIPEYIAPGVAKIISWEIPAGSRLSVSAVVANASSGQFVATLMA